MKLSLKYFSPALSFLLLPLLIRANDGVFYARGNTLFPVQETEIRMEKEFLSLTRDGDFVNIVVHFTFFNPGPRRELIVGFVTPPGDGDMEEDAEDRHPQIQQFTVVMNGRALEWKVARVDGSGYQLSPETADLRDFLYHFKADFQPGVNEIHHTYRFQAASWVEAPFMASYVLTTGTTWAGGEIGDFTLEIDMGENITFTLPWSFQVNGTPAPWRIEGTGTFATDKRFLMENEYKVVCLERGKVILHQEHFRPARNLDVDQYYIHNEAYLWMPAGSENPLTAFMFDYMIFSIEDEEFSHTFTLDELRLFRNFLYARKGYVFKDKELKRIFSQCIWYRPNPGLKADQIQFDARDQAILKLILDNEKKLSPPR